MSKMSPTQRALAECKRRGWIAQVVEHTVPRTFIKRDLFGVIDIVAIANHSWIVGIQVTSGANHSARVAKIAAEPRAWSWHSAGGRLVVWSFALRGARGKRKRYELREQWIGIAEFDAAASQKRSAA